MHLAIKTRYDPVHHHMLIAMRCATSNRPILSTENYFYKLDLQHICPGKSFSNLCLLLFQKVIGIRQEHTLKGLSPHCESRSATEWKWSRSHGANKELEGESLSKKAKQMVDDDGFTYMWQQCNLVHEHSALVLVHVNNFSTQVHEFWFTVFMNHSKATLSETQWTCQLVLSMDTAICPCFETPQFEMLCLRLKKHFLNCDLKLKCCCKNIGGPSPNPMG